jgi:hypothetical protein
MFVYLYELIIPEGKETKEGYVILNHNQQYTINLINKSNKNCDAEIYLDGDMVGCYRLSSGQSWVVEHPADSQQRFTFFKSGSNEASIVGESVIEKDNKGLVTVKFYPEKERIEATRSYKSGSKGLTKGGGDDCDYYDYESKGLTTRGGFEGGISGLSGHSDAKYTSTHPIDRDYDKVVIITLRLVAESKSDINPPSSRQQRMSNPIPPSVQ